MLLIASKYPGIHDIGLPSLEQIVGSVIAGMIVLPVVLLQPDRVHPPPFGVDAISNKVGRRYGESGEYNPTKQDMDHDSLHHD